MNIKSKIITASLLSVFLFSGCGFDNKKDAVIMINNTPITKQQYQKEFDKLAGNPMFKQMGVDIKADPNGYINLMLKDKVVNELIVKTILDNEIEKRNIKVSNEDIDAELKKIIDKVGTKEKFNEILKQSGVSASQFKEDLKQEVRVQKLINSFSLVKISDEDAEKFYNSHLSEFKYPDKVKASHILITADENTIRELIKSKEESKNLTEQQIEEKVQQDLAAKKQKAEKLLAEAKKDPSQFAKLAKENSDDPGSAQQGGDLGYFTKDQMVPEFSEAAFSAKPSVVTGIVKSPYGYHIILVKDRIAAGTEPFEKVKEDIKMYLENQEKINVLQKFLTKAQNEAKIEYIDKSFNPDDIQAKIKEQVKSNPMLQNMKKEESKEQK
ncbi:MAG: peptidylprolyl isomerase [Candidatus Gastranaerophilaceae bacterium]